MSFLPAVKIWIWVSVLASLAGWVLSMAGQLNRVGYVVVGLAAAFVFHEAHARGQLNFCQRPWRWQRVRRRYSRAFPFMFAVLALLVLLGGVLYPPSNHTGLSYRIPRVLHWLETEEWSWIFTPNHRMNTRACGIEWLSAPLLLFTKSDRGLFLLNFFPFLLTPGLLFSLLTRVGVRAQVAWQWMWLLPTGYVILLQAGSAGNDAYPIAYALAALDFACRAWTSRRASDLWHSLLAVALLGGAKASNLPLTLPWLVLVLPLWRLLRDKPIGTSRVAVLAVLASFLPTAMLNLSHCGNWSGLNLEREGMNMSNPIVGIWGNAFLLLVNNLCPPFFPLAGWWNQHALQLLPGVIVRPLVANFEQGFHMLWELPTEDWAGIGPGVTVLMLVAAWWALPRFRLRHKSPRSGLGISPAALRFALISPWVALLAYCAKSGMVTPARLIAPYYPLLLPLLLVGAEQATLVRRRWWRGLAWAVFLVAFVVLIVTPARPLWPAQTILTKALELQPDNRLLARALKTYSVYALRSDLLAELRAALPPDLKVVGFLGTPDDLDISFWRPYSTRRVDQIGHRETAAQVRARKLQYAIVSGVHFELAKMSFTDWLTEMRAEVVAETTVTVSVSVGPQRYYLVQFRD
jgi:hypothetical protein